MNLSIEELTTTFCRRETMKLLLDTHAFIWLNDNPLQLSIAS